MKYDIRSIAKSIVAEVHIVTDGVIKLSETANSITIAGFTETTNAPADNQFKPLYFYDTYGRTVAGILQFNVADEGAEISVAYDGYGSIIWADDYNSLELEVDTINSHLADIAPHPAATNIPRSTTANITYYVATTGSDTTGDGTIGLPFRTIQFAIAKLPKVINHNVIINVSAGTYSENIVISGFIGSGTFAFNGSADLANSVNYKILSARILNVSIHLNVLGFNFITTIADSTFCFNSMYLFFRFNTIDGIGATFYGFKAEGGGVVQIRECTISNKNTAIVSNEQSRIFSNANGGVGNTIGLQTMKAGEIIKSGGQPAGTTAEASVEGGLIR